MGEIHCQFTVIQSTMKHTSITILSIATLVLLVGCKTWVDNSLVGNDQQDFVGLEQATFTLYDNDVDGDTIPTDSVYAVDAKLHYDAVTGEIVSGEYRYKMIDVEGKAYSLGETEVPQWLWKAVMGNNPSYRRHDFLPVESVTWDECQEFVEILSRCVGVAFSLPTAQQWECAARGGKDTMFQFSGSNNLDSVAWCVSNSNDRTHRIGMKQPNQLGFYDMTGNVEEYTCDFMNPLDCSVVAICGGDYGCGEEWCNVRERDFDDPMSKWKRRGLRLAHNPSDKIKPLQTLKWDSVSHALVYGKERYQMIYVEGGMFTMGGKKNDDEAFDWEFPAHQVTLDDFYMGMTEVPQWLWKAVMKENPSKYREALDRKPVEQVSWNDCLQFIRKLNAMTGLKFTLPTEAQWEYAARGGAKSKGYLYSGSNSFEKVMHDVNYTDWQYQRTCPNELGIYEMTGNVSEWCLDWYGEYTPESQTNPQGPKSGRYKVIRGGCWLSQPHYARVSFRASGSPTGKDDRTGLRLVMN